MGKAASEATKPPGFILCLWVTPKVFDDLADPRPAVESFFDHYADWIGHADPLVVNFCAGNGDHILNCAGPERWSQTFDWARYNCGDTAGTVARRRKHNLDWLRRVVEGGETSGNPFMSGPDFILSEQTLDYHKLHGIYACFRQEAVRRGVTLKLLEYLEPGPELCMSEWKTRRHPEAARGAADSPSNLSVIDVTSRLHAEEAVYAAYPHGIAEGTRTGDFVARQCAAFTREMGLDGVFLGNQFGLCGFWHPSNAPPATVERRAGIRRFFQQMREQMGDKLVYWMDTYWRTAVEMEAWAMEESNYHLLDGVLCSLFAVIAQPAEMKPNIESKLALQGPPVLFSFDFVDPYYCYRVYKHLKGSWRGQHDLYRQVGGACRGVSFFANDTFGHWVFPDPLGQTWDVVRRVRGW